MSSWRQQAACRGADVALFYPERGKLGGSGRKRLEDDPRVKYCKRCPVTAECLDESLTLRGLGSYGEELAGINTGIWGGKTHEERRKLLKRKASHG